jgi:hypothetical protein
MEEGELGDDIVRDIEEEEEQREGVASPVSKFGVRVGQILMKVSMFRASFPVGRQTRLYCMIIQTILRDVSTTIL